MDEETLVAEPKLVCVEEKTSVAEPKLICVEESVLTDGVKLPA
ncbi:MAG: hypothetical protein WBP45_14820 [Daejeonella sp.]